MLAGILGAPKSLVEPFYQSRHLILPRPRNIHAGIRTTLSGPSDYDNDGYCGFEIVEAREKDTIGTEGIITKITDRVGITKPVSMSIDIDTLDPACSSSLSHFCPKNVIQIDR